MPLKDTEGLSVETKLVELSEELTSMGFERFTQGQLEQTQLKEFYDVLGTWSKASQHLVETMEKMNIRDVQE
jgi:hypothetical protein